MNQPNDQEKLNVQTIKKSNKELQIIRLESMNFSNKVNYFVFDNCILSVTVRLNEIKKSNRFLVNRLQDISKGKESQLKQEKIVIPKMPISGYQGYMGIHAKLRVE